MKECPHCGKSVAIYKGKQIKYIAAGKFIKYISTKCSSCHAILKLTSECIDNESR